MSLFERAVDYSKDIFRNIRGIKESQHLFDDLSDDPLNWEAANSIDIYTHPAITGQSLIQRAFDYSKNDFIDYPFENITASRYSDGSVACWYGSESLETTVFETRYHFIQEIRSSWDVFQSQLLIKIDRRVANVYCHGLAFDLTSKINEFPWLVDPVNYTNCQETGRRVAIEGHPLLRVPSARHIQGSNLVAFNSTVLSNVRDFCTLHYVFDTSTREIKIYRGKELIIEPMVVEI